MPLNGGPRVAAEMRVVWEAPIRILRLGRGGIGGVGSVEGSSGEFRRGFPPSKIAEADRISAIEDRDLAEPRRGGIQERGIENVRTSCRRVPGITPTPPRRGNARRAAKTSRFDGYSRRSFDEAPSAKDCRVSWSPPRNPAARLTDRDEKRRTESRPGRSQRVPPKV